MRELHTKWMLGGCTMLGLLVWTLPATAQGLGSSGSGMSGSSGLGGGASSGATLGGSNFLQSTSNFLSSTGTNTTTNANRNAAGNRGGTGASTSATGTGSAFQGIATSNLLGSYYVNPLAAGLPSGTTQPRFGAPLYTITAANLSATGTGGVGGANRGGTATTSTSAYAGSSSVGTRRAPAYATTIGFDFVAPTMTSLQTSLQQTISESTRLPSKGNITVVVDGETIVLRGTASTDRERRMAEALVRLTPGVHDVRNDLEVRETTSASRPAP
jgi:hypothetical protein